jgi:hypothetical protein
LDAWQNLNALRYELTKKALKMNKKVIVFISLATILTISILASTASAAVSTTEYSLNGKGAAGQWVPVAGHVINAYIVMSDSGKDGTIYVSIQHARGFSVAQGNVVFKWNMNHVTVEAKDLLFKSAVGSSGFSGLHTIVISWLTSGDSVQGQSSLNAGNGVNIGINGQYKLASATMVLDPVGGPHHDDETYYSTFGAVFQGDGSISGVPLST